MTDRCAVLSSCQKRAGLMIALDERRSSVGGVEVGGGSGSDAGGGGVGGGVGIACGCC